MGLISLLWLAGIFYLLFVMDPLWIKMTYRGKTAEQKAVIRYFLVRGLFRKKMSDAEFDSFVLKSVPDLKQTAMDKIGLDEDQLKEIEPVHFEGFVFDKESYQKKGKDKLWRSSKYEVAWLFFSDNQIYIYKKTFSLHEKKDKEITVEYFYKDITNFSTSSEYHDVKMHNKFGKITTVDVDTQMFKLVVPGDSFLCAMTQSEYVENAIQGMKAKLREKKLM